MQQQRSLLRLITEFILGRKYWANVTYTRGVDEAGLSYHIFSSRQQAREHARSLSTNRSYGFVETVSFRSRKQY